jgi:predicted secreted Zn-dependent protease
LEHEQLHFDLSQIYARQLRKKIADSKLNLFNFTKESNKIFDDIFFLYKERQNLYDTETNHGINNAAQKKWEKNIETELNELETYSVN